MSETTHDYTTMPAGREMDALVAERVMGWLPHEVNGEVLWTHNATRQWSVRAVHIPHYSTKIAAAWQVVDCLMASHSMVSVSVVQGHGWWCVIYPPSGACVEGEYAETAPLAICRAALAAVE